jgi:ABC-type antimicrobial peptide transport system permease subunit
VLERTKEIGILRAVGASKGDVSRVFNAETMIEGLAAGLVGIGLTQLLIIPINLLINNVFELNAKAYLHPTAAVILVCISVFLTFIAGLIPAKSAARKDPVVALRSE